MISKKRLLVINDEPAMLDAICKWLIDAGYRVECCLLGQEGVKLAQKSKFDLVILDYHLKKEGIKTAEDFIPQFKKLIPAIPIIVVSATLNYLDKERLGVTAVLSVTSVFWNQLITLVNNQFN